MKKTLIITSVFSLAVILTACSAQPAENQNVNQPQANNCVEKDGTCCLNGGSCAGALPNCPQGTKPKFSGCNEKCVPNIGCVAENDDKTLIMKQLFAAKYNKEISEITVTVNNQTDKFIRGGVVIGEPGPGAGGYFLAAEVNGKWQLVADGNGAIDCDLVKSYNFPQDMISDCAPSEAYWQTFNGPDFSFIHLKTWQVSPSISGVRKIYAFNDKINGYAGNNYQVSILSVSPNQGGVTLDDWVSEIIKQGGWMIEKDKILMSIGGVAAAKLVISESEAGLRYLFISKDNKSMYDWQFVGVKSDTIGKIISSFKFIK